ncbi:hypothetical protein RSOL_375790, partial [Rhizoctonia solani AG-3 Rhs1AP]
MDGTPPKVLATQIDSALDTFHIELEQRVAQSRSILARTRNQVLSISPISCLSNEILSEIFTYVVYDPIDPSNPVPMESSLVKIYKSLHCLLGVCSIWRNVILARGSFWSMIPIIELSSSSISLRSQGRPCSTGLSLERSGTTDLHLAAIFGKISKCDDIDLTKYLSRLRSINIIARSTFVIGRLLNQILKPGSPLHVSELSLRFESKVFSDHIPPQRPCLSHIEPWTNFEDLLESLSVLRLSDIMLDWSRITFSHRLVQLELQNTNLGSDSNLISLLTSLSSATELRTLELISVTTYPNPDTQITTTKPIISLPNLQTMVARNLYFNTLAILLSSITSRSHRLVLHLTGRTFEITPLSDENPEEVATERAVDIFRQVTVDTLLLEAFEDEGPWLSAMDIWNFLHAMPDVKTLRMHDWDFYPEFCRMIQRPDVSSESKFPQFKYIYLSLVSIRDEEAFKNMVASYFESLERIELAGSLITGPEGAELSGYLEGGEPLVTWFRENAPNFVLNSNYGVPPEFRDPVWQLW